MRIPAKNPRVPVKPEPGSVRRFRARCHVVADSTDGQGKACGWTYTNSIRAAVEEEARWHRSQHTAEWARLVQLTAYADELGAS